MFYLIAHFVLRPLFLLLFRPHVVGRENVPARVRSSWPATTCRSSTAWSSRSWRRAEVGYLAKAEYFTGPGFGGWLTRVLFTALGALPVHAAPTGRRRRRSTPRCRC